MSLPIGMCRRAFSYDDALEDLAPMTPPPADMGSIPWKPVMPERKYQHLAQVPDPRTAPGKPHPLALLLQLGEPQWLQATTSPCMCFLCLSWSQWAFFTFQFKLEWSRLLSSLHLPHPTSQCQTHAPWSGSADAGPACAPRTGPALHVASDFLRFTGSLMSPGLGFKCSITWSDYSPCPVLLHPPPTPRPDRWPR